VRANSFQKLAIFERIAQWSVAIIGLGLLVLGAAVYSATTPALTGMALVALGATGATLSRFQGTPALTPILLLHATLYGSLYAMFVGAALHTLAQQGHRLSLTTILDLAVSLGLAAMVFTMACSVICGHRSAG
jgi:hypothetical protein